MQLLPSIPPYVRRDTAWKLASFIRNCIDDPLPQSQFLAPVRHIAEFEYGLYESVGDDPSFMLFGSRLKIPVGKVRISYKACVLEGDLANPSLYLDTGSGFSERQRFYLGEGPLTNCEKEMFLPQGTRRIRFDPVSAPGRFQLTEFEITSIT